ncbi:uncharacterized protein LOC122368917 [Amphibalanus amphitrite]|uniref:uncharacterized protein LOC122368917 n=1 Tax=Amphibalanus amphitrite TaxID=1232801 RepID=UPI001C902272|nr:uncharacterized protein LOC122368917 [Amphibalanus amphitrite]
MQLAMMAADSSTDKVSVANIIIDMWDLVNQILEQQTLLENWMKGGFMNIAKARYVMGQHSVGENQLPSGDREISAGLLVTRDQAPPHAAEPAAFTLSPQSSDTEPLRWFSALPPGALRDAQRQFRRAAEISCEVASLKSRLQTMMARLSDARKESEVEGTDTELKTAQLTEAVEALAVK